MGFAEAADLIRCGAVLLVSFLVYYLLGRAASLRFGWKLLASEAVCTGFFIYFSFFQILAELMIFSKQKLHVLGWTWLFLLLAGLTGCAFILWQKRDKNPDAAFFAPPQGKSASLVRVRPTLSARLLYFVMVMAVACLCLSALLLQRNVGWDFAYYIGNVTTSVDTDTMYLYDGSSGLLRHTIEFRYALSGFYMNTAWISQMLGIHGLLLQKYVVGIQCVILTELIVYSFAMEVFDRDRQKAALLVILTVLLTIFWDVYDTSAQFLMLRSYEAKAYCANVVLPMTAFMIYRIWKQPDKEQNWAGLFIVAFASVAVSMSALVLVPALIFIMLLAHWIVSRQWDFVFLRRSVCCLLPNICYMLIYFASKLHWLVVEV